MSTTVPKTVPIAAATDPPTSDTVLRRGPRFSLHPIGPEDLDAVDSWLADDRRRADYVHSDVSHEDVAAAGFLAVAQEVPSAQVYTARVPQYGCVGLVTFHPSATLQGLYDGDIIVAPSLPLPGVGTEVFALGIDMLFSEAAANKLWGFVSLGNPASERMCHRLGFRREGFVREHLPTNDGFQDAFIYSLLRRDWRSPVPIEVPAADDAGGTSR